MLSFIWQCSVYHGLKLHVLRSQENVHGTGKHHVKYYTIHHCAIDNNFQKSFLINVNYWVTHAQCWLFASWPSGRAFGCRYMYLEFEYSLGHFDNFAAWSDSATDFTDEQSEGLQPYHFYQLLKCGKPQHIEPLFKPTKGITPSQK